MKYVILRDDDTNALTPIGCLEKLYRPFLDRGLPVNLATIPNVSTEAVRFDGKPEGFLMNKNGKAAKYVPIGSNTKLVTYLKQTGIHILQHGFSHELVSQRAEFDREDRDDISQRLDSGECFLREAGFPKPTTFVAPYDKLSRTSLEEVAKRFRVLSTGWFEFERLPLGWLPNYAVKKLFHHPHWQVDGTILLTHPGCHLSYNHPYETMLETIKKSIESRQVTVLVTHWWEYFRDQKPDDHFIGVLHETADYLAKRKHIKVISFDELIKGNIDLN